MSKKTIDTSKITNDLQGASSFFGKSDKSTTRKDAKKASRSQSTKSSQALAPPTPESTVIYEEPAATSSESKPASGSSTQDSEQASMLARYHDSSIEAIRKTVKQFGKESVFVRVTPEEKRRIADIAYSYKRQGIRTTENEISRIGISFLLEDHEQNGERSILARVIAALLA